MTRDELLSAVRLLQEKLAKAEKERDVAIEQLAEYKKTGFTPEEIQAIAGMAHSNLLDAISKVDELLNS